MKKGIFQRHRRFIPLYLMMIPGFLYLFINNYIPMAGIIIAFKQVNFRLGILKSPWVGLNNFTYLFRTNDAWTITRNTILYNVAFIVLGTIMAIVLAILLNELKSKMGKKVYQTVILVPYLISMVVVSYLVNALLATETDFINNSIIGVFGGAPVSWYSTPKYWPFILMLVYLWKNFGYQSIIYYASVVGLDAGLYEAAAIDGANKVKQFFYITLPLLKGIFRTNIIMWSISVSGFFIWSKLFSPISADTSTVVPMVYMYDKLFGAENVDEIRRDAGIAAAVGVMLCLFIVFIFTLVNRLIKDDDLEF